MKALITGITGQDGSYLAEYLLEQGYSVHGMIRRSSSNNFGRIAHLIETSPVTGSIGIHYGDLTDMASVARLVQDLAPGELYNLGGQSHVGVSFKNPLETANATGLGALRVLEAVRQHSPTTKVYQASSSEMFGDQSGPKNEDTPFRSRSPYASAKIFAHENVRAYREAYDIFAVSGILFNHESPRRGEEFVTQKIVKQLKEVLNNKRDIVKLGNLDARRDWGYAGDYVKAMHAMLQLEEPQDFVIATNRTHSVREFVELVAKELNIINFNWRNDVGYGTYEGETKVFVKTSKEFFRPADIQEILGDYTKAEEELGWYPETSFSELVERMVHEA